MNPIECLTGHGQDSAIWVWVTVWLCVAVSVGYVVIAIRWVRLFGFSVVQVSLVAMFLLCMICGYLTVAWAVFEPNKAYTARLALLFFLNVSNVVFIVSTFGKRFQVESKHAQVGRMIIEFSDEFDSDIHTLAKEIKLIAAEMRKESP